MVAVSPAPVKLPVGKQASQRPPISPELRATSLYLRAVFAELLQVCLKFLLVELDFLAQGPYLLPVFSSVRASSRPGFVRLGGKEGVLALLPRLWQSSVFNGCELGKKENEKCTPAFVNGFCQRP